MAHIERWRRKTRTEKAEMSKQWQDNLEFNLWMLHLKLSETLDQIHAESIASFRTLARSAGQRTRWDR